MNRRKVMPCLDALDTKTRGVIKNCLQNLPPEEVLDASSLLHGHALLVSHSTPLSLNPKTLNDTLLCMAGHQQSRRGLLGIGSRVMYAVLLRQRVTLLFSAFLGNPLPVCTPVNLNQAGGKTVLITVVGDVRLHNKGLTLAVLFMAVRTS